MLGWDFLAPQRIPHVAFGGCPKSWVHLRRLAAGLDDDRVDAACSWVARSRLQVRLAQCLEDDGARKYEES